MRRTPTRMFHVRFVDHLKNLWQWGIGFMHLFSGYALIAVNFYLQVFMGQPVDEPQQVWRPGDESNQIQTSNCGDDLLARAPGRRQRQLVSKRISKRRENIDRAGNAKVTGEAMLASQ